MKEKGAKKSSLTKRLALIFCIIALTVVVSFAAFIVATIVFYNDKEITSSVNESEKELISEESSQPEIVIYGEDTLDADFTNLLLVNSQNPLPEDYAGEQNLITVEEKYINGNLRQINKEIWPYMKAMIEAAWADGVELYIWSPYRSYETQNKLYQNKVNKLIESGLDNQQAEAEAATVVARPGTSEHQTGLCADFNMANSKFEQTKEFAWMKENAADYGFIMRYSAEKQPITGVIHESWHWRFVGINAAKEMNELGLCLEEYVEYIENQKNRGQEE